MTLEGKYICGSLTKLQKTFRKLMQCVCLSHEQFKQFQFLTNISKCLNKNILCQVVQSNIVVPHDMESVPTFPYLKSAVLPVLERDLYRSFHSATGSLDDALSCLLLLTHQFTIKEPCLQLCHPDILE